MDIFVLVISPIGGVVDSTTSTPPTPSHSGNSSNSSYAHLPKNSCHKDASLIVGGPLNFSLYVFDKSGNLNLKNPYFSTTDLKIVMEPTIKSNI